MPLFEVRTGLTTRLIRAHDEIEAAVVAVTGRRFNLRVDPMTPDRARWWLDQRSDGATAGHWTPKLMADLGHHADELDELSKAKQ